MDKGCQEPCCVEKRMVIIPLGVGHCIQDAAGVSFEVVTEIPYDHDKKAKKFVEWMNYNVPGGFVQALRKELDKN